MTYRGYQLQVRFEGATRYVRVTKAKRIIARAEDHLEARKLIDARNKQKQVKA